jgi:hypothetical protein
MNSAALDLRALKFFREAIESDCGCESRGGEEDFYPLELKENLVI